MTRDTCQVYHLSADSCGGTATNSPLANYPTLHCRIGQLGQFVPKDRDAKITDIFERYGGIFGSGPPKDPISVPWFLGL